MRGWNLIAIFPAASLLILAGCGGDSSVVSDLKEKTFPVDSTLTYEQALDRRAVCESTNWAVREDNRGREVVRYECNLKGVQELNDVYVESEGGEAAELNLASEAIHFIEWFHDEGEYSLSDTSVYFHVDNEADEEIQLSEYTSFHVAIDDDVSDVLSLIPAIDKYRTPSWDALGW